MNSNSFFLPILVGALWLIAVGSDLYLRKRRKQKISLLEIILGVITGAVVVYWLIPVHCF